MNSTACLMVTIFCELGIAQQGSANNGYLHLSLARIPYSFFNISLLVQGDGRSTQQTVEKVFILLERKSPCQRSMARLARITVIPNLQFLFSKQFLAGRSRLFAFWILSSCNMKAGGKKGRRKKRKSSYGYCCHLGDFQWRLQKWNFLGSLLLLPCGEEHAIWLEQRDHTNVEAALYHLLGQRWPFVGCRGVCPRTFCKHCQMPHYLCTASWSGSPSELSSSTGVTAGTAWIETERKSSSWCFCNISYSRCWTWDRPFC